MRNISTFTIELKKNVQMYFDNNSSEELSTKESENSFSGAPRFGKIP